MIVCTLVVINIIVFTFKETQLHGFNKLLLSLKVIAQRYGDSNSTKFNNVKIIA